MKDIGIIDRTELKHIIQGCQKLTAKSQKRYKGSLTKRTHHFTHFTLFGATGDKIFEYDL